MKKSLPLIIFVGCIGLFILAAVGPASLFRRDASDDSATDAPAAAAVEQEDDGPPPITEAPGPAPKGMVWIPGGSFTMGTEELPPTGENPDKIKADEIPAHEVIVDGFWMDETEVTNAEFAKFVDETGYVTFAEIKPKREDFIGVVPDISAIPEENLVAGALIFNKDFDRENFTTEYTNWEYQAWKYQPGADWRHPTGPDSSIDDKMDHPVVNVVYRDCVAYANWAGKRLPTEAEWEYASRGGHEGWKYSWGNEFQPNGQFMCNYWQGTFPTDRQNLDGFLDTAPVKSFPPNDYGLFDMAGNVWEWVNDYYHHRYYLESPKRNPQGPEKWLDPGEPLIEKRVTRGGSFLCNTNNCTGYRNAARMRSDVSSASYHTGFRCVIDTKMDR
ncbi:formylglycine-generating enzyme family protein [Rubinisphaera margarita]|uniref:formylglycine-generating enzyme family protein n=1 Tax=Rubinisphaera margarita TaxID=2909586 RepID=UPI001EE7C6A4|nr:formylglycine-generating enzyme family protein [Rubinisphaera margarita]MCG6157608.1 formylglycine-generating enzyme family protein [Rubinisphaera margarita]